MHTSVVLWVGWLFLTSMAGIWTLLEMIGVSGSPRIAVPIFCVAAIITIGGVGLSSERRKLAVRLLQGRVSSEDFNVAARRDFRPDMLAAIRKAEREIIFVDGISSSFLNADFFCLLAQRLEEAPKLTVRFVMLSDQQLFLRVQHHRVSQSREDHRSFEEVLSRKAQIAKLPASVLDRVRPELRSAVAERLKVEEWHLPVFIVPVKIDDLVFLSIPSHRRHSNTVTIKLSDRNSPLHRLVCDYINFVLGDGAAYFLTKPYPELVPLLDDQGTVRLALPRQAVQSLGYRTRTIFGFVINGAGQLLVRQRGDGAYDNRGLWDKSFGGHEEWGVDDTAERIVIRELKEELLTSTDSPNIVFSGEIEGFQRSVGADWDAWIVVLLGRWGRFTSQRQVGSVSVSKPIDVALYACYCPEPERIVAANSETSRLQWINLDEFEAFVGASEVTNDLQCLVGTPELAKLRQFAGLILRR